MRLERHPAVTPNVKAKCADPAEHGHDGAKEKPNRDRHVLSRFAIFRAVTKRTRVCLFGCEQDRSA
jgi:hypothetical protein